MALRPSARWLPNAANFAAGTLVVRDVGLLSDDMVRVYRSTAPDTPTIYRRGHIAEAEPAVPGWRMSVDGLFRRVRRT